MLRTSFVAATLATTITAIKIEGKAKCPFGYDQPSSEVLAQTEQPSVDYIADIFNLEGAVVKTPSLTIEQYEEVAAHVVDAYLAVEDVVKNNENARGRFVGCMLRTAGHDFMDYKWDAEIASQIGGSDGCINLNDGDNAGLQQCLTKFGIPAVFDKVKAQVSLADFFVIMGEAAAAKAAAKPEELAAKFRDGFKFGRTTVPHCEWNVHRMPNPEHGCQGDDEQGIRGLRQIFNENIYKGRLDAWALTAAISGAHTVGKANLHNSGYDGHWSSAEEQGKFNNDYYTQIMARGWGPEVAVNGNAGKNQWKITDEGRDDKHKIMSLNTDMCMFFSKNNAEDCTRTIKKTKWSFKNQGNEWVSHRQRWLECLNNEMPSKPDQKENDLLASTSGECCAWIKEFGFFGKNMTKLDSRCGIKFDTKTDHHMTDEGAECCGTLTKHCDFRYQTGGPASDIFYEFMRDESIWLNKYHEAWTIATENGDDTLVMLDPKKGDLRHVPQGEAAVNCFEKRDCIQDFDDTRTDRTARENKRAKSAFKRQQESATCYYGAGAHALQESGFSSSQCYNRYRLISDQRPSQNVYDKDEPEKLLRIEPRQNLESYQWVNAIKLANPSQSSTEDIYTADTVLARQNGKPVHAYANNDNWPSSCSITDKKATGDQWWQADFASYDDFDPVSNLDLVRNDHPVRNVRITYKADDVKALNGAKVFAGDHECGAIKYIKGTTKRPTFFAEVGCDDAVASSIRIEHDSQIAFCDITAYKGDRFPTVLPDLFE